MKKREVYRISNVDGPVLMVIRGRDDTGQLLAYIDYKDWALCGIDEEWMIENSEKIGMISRWKMFLLGLGMITININEV